ncbi:hypothetical protein VTL71DRAFT_3528 [Oculimacula yallundae]|uniref:FMN hydroxy acid dehydrogenase domain-containing protein n=1 Tax=Oculimacula yallundae TaxID=86028 RepID=A0ABR4C9K7_9HELO
MSNRPKDLDANVVTIDDLKKQAEKKLPVTLKDYYNLGAGELQTLHDNEAAYDRYRLRPRVLCDVDNVDTSTYIFGTRVSMPFGLAPAAAHKLAHPDGEIGSSRAAAAHGIAMCLSAWATSEIEEVIKAGGDNPYAMQVTFFRDRGITKRIIQEAEKAGYKALFVGVDHPILGHRFNETRNNFKFPDGIRFPIIANGEGETGLKENYNREFDPTLRWEETIAWLRQNTKLEIWLKGVCAPEDIQLAIDHGVDGVVISNHGGRQLDGVPATLDSLRVCAQVARGRIPLAIDGGIRRGADIFKALALGATMCFAGRIPIWGLAYNGEKGVQLGIEVLYGELKRTMALMGCKTISDISSDHLVVLGANGLLAKL